ncbi:MAG: HRDC domain-containing protein, partial [Nocardioidaceae bacterium]
MVDATAPDPPAPAPAPENEAPLLTLRDGLPPVVDTPQALDSTVAAFAAGTGPVAIDAERASGYRYSARAYLVQLRRVGAGTALVDPIPFGELSTLGGALGDAEWIVHAASQDLSCLADLGLRPTALFDTELAGRLLGYPRVGLGTLVETVLGSRMRKEHSAADWSKRPLPEPWLEYAALDVEVLLELREALATQLEEAGKREWAREEFAHLLTMGPPRPRTDPWRRTSGLHRVRGRRGLAAVRELWQARDEVAADRDSTPGRILPDAAIVAAANALPADKAALLGLKGFHGRGAARYSTRWLDALHSARALPDAELPPVAARYDGPPPPRAWAERDPVAAARLNTARTSLKELAESLDLPLENLLTPDYVRRLLWQPPTEPAGPGEPGAPGPLADLVADRLRELGARAWQIQLT